MGLSLIAAMAKRRVIGCAGGMPWRLPADLQHFRAITLNKPLLMGRKTYESIGKPLPHRRNIVVTHRADIHYPGCEVATLEEALRLTEAEPEVMVIGGATLYEQCLPQAEQLYLTFIEAEFTGDTFFPAWDEALWERVESISHEPDEKNSYPYCFTHWQRIKEVPLFYAEGT